MIAFKKILSFSLSVMKYLSLITMTLWMHFAAATWFNTPSVIPQNIQPFVCPTTNTYKTVYKDYYGSSCTLEIPEGNGVPVTGDYKITMILAKTPGDATNSRTLGSTSTFSARIDASRQLSEQSITWGGANAWNNGETDTYFCLVLTDASGKNYIINNLPVGCNKVDGGGVLPPGPNFVSCAFNNGSALDVSLGEVERSSLGTSPGTLPGVEKSLPVTCTGDGTVTYSVSFEYTPLTVGSSQLITSSASGVGIAMFLNDTLVNTTDKISRTYGVGTTTETLKFEPVRNPATQVKDIPTGAFTASAVMVLTVE